MRLIAVLVEESISVFDFMEIFTKQTGRSGSNDPT